MHIMQRACDTGSYEMWKQYSAKMQASPPIHLRDLLDIKPLGAGADRGGRKHHLDPQALRDAGHVLGALSPEAHKTLNVAMNRIGAKSDSAARAARIRRISCPSRTATTRRPRSSRWPRAASA
jgi:glutamate synthase (NADPH/NADH) large chain